ncbi:hypothetical protein ER308_02705 [Egibacter rhizosphaerae]|uniref:CopC domain-containing protein n=1 Tax=Egibacter rhizosphaerae TaxID=1670831 RepID=A0A411YBI1_9ACTN|nr:copper resistance protein CopC [Egibacter rhizosphaerae]QBI18581.1 hypothetical protein ER308_02705 [Egibacter rhizosphaerae]
MPPHSTSGPCRSPAAVVLLLVAGVLAASALLIAPPAWGHAHLVDSEPADEETVGEAPEEVSLEFDEVVDPQHIEVVGPDGDDLATGDPEQEDEVVRQPIHGPTSTGEHVVTIDLVADDGHEQQESIVFEYTGATAGAGENGDLTAAQDDGTAAGGALPRVLAIAGGAVVLALVVTLAIRRLNRAGAHDTSD